MEVCTVGGYEEVGKNMTAVKVGEDVFLFDMGLCIPSIVELQEETLLESSKEEGPSPKGRSEPPSEKRLREFGAIPDDRVLDKLGWRNKVRAIFISHAHLDHVGSVPFMVNRYPNVPIYASPFTLKFLETVLKNEGIKYNNPLKIAKPDSTQIIKGKSGSYKVDFIHTTHSTLDCLFLALHTPKGAFFYALDLKFDNHPTMGKPPSYKKMKEVGRKKVKVLVLDALYSGTEKKPGSETVAKHLVEDSIAKVKNSRGAIFITTFSSHIERLNSIVEFGKKTGREIIFLGRSLNKYVGVAMNIKKCPFQKDIKLVKYRKQIDSTLAKINKNRDKYIVVCTGHQAEENSMLDRITKGNTPFEFRKGDNLIFSSSIIPVPINIAARAKMDNKLKRIGVRIQNDVHVHGHGSREDMRDLLRMVRPEHVIPTHGTLQQETPLIELATEFGYKFGETSHLSSDGKVLKFD